MKIEHLGERIADYQKSIDQVIEKRILWETKTKRLLLKILEKIVKSYQIGWKVQELDWIKSGYAINIGFDSFPTELIPKIQKIKHFDFVPSGSLVFSQSFNGDIVIFILYEDVQSVLSPENIMDLGSYSPRLITEKFIVEKVDEFLKEMIQREVPQHNRLGFVTKV